LKKRRRITDKQAEAIALTLFIEVYENNQEIFPGDGYITMAEHISSLEYLPKKWYDGKTHDSKYGMEQSV
jgi:hypothetical protein